MFEETSINIGFMKINNTDQASSVSFGQNQKLNRFVAAKKNQGFGQQHADSTVRYTTIHLVLDEDGLDNMAAKSNGKP